MLESEDMQVSNLTQIYGGAWHEEAPLENHTWLKLKNTFCKYMWLPSNIKSLSNFIQDQRMQYVILGNGSNTLLNSIDGVVIKLQSMKHIRFDNGLIVVDAGVSNKVLITKALSQKQGGFEFLYTIPGTLGGSIIMNAGAHGDCIGNHIQWVEGIERQTGKCVRIDKSDMKFDYRHSSLQENIIVTRCALRAVEVNPVDSKERLLQIDRYVTLKQPRELTLGSTFKNSENEQAWKLLNQLSQDDLSCKNIYFSDMHRNFLINRGHATAQEVFALVNRVRQKVFEKTSIKLELEIKVEGICLTSTIDSLNK